LRKKGEEKAMLIRHLKYSAKLSKIHSYRRVFRRFYPLGKHFISRFSCPADHRLLR